MLYLAKFGQLEIDEIALEIPILIVMAKVILVLGFRIWRKKNQI